MQDPGHRHEPGDDPPRSRTGRQLDRPGAWWGDRPLSQLSSRAEVSLCFGVIAFVVLAFSRLWRSGQLTLDGPGVSMYLRLAVDSLRTGSIPYWTPDMWAGAPVWGLLPSFPQVSLVPLAMLLGPEGAIKLATLGFQVAGAWGTFVLARSLWGRHSPAPLVAGVVYALHPLVVSHGAFFGHEPTLGVLAATPWLVWSFRLALRGDGAPYVALAGLLAGFAVLYQAEHAYGLAVLCALMLVVNLAQARTAGRGRRGPDGVLVRAAAVALIGLGVSAHWLLPFLSLAKSFVLSPPELVRDFLITNPLSREPGAFLRRAPAIVDPVVFNRTNILDGPFYLSWVCILLGLVTIAAVGRRDRDRTLTTILFASAINVWMSTGAIPLAASGPARRGQVVFFLAIGLAGGLLLGSFLRAFRLRRPALLAIAGAALLVAVPFLTPFLALQRLVPLLASIRFPRFYPVAALGLALAAAYPLLLVQEWARGRRPHLALGLASAAAVAVVGLFLVDVYPYRSYYQVRRADASAYDAVMGPLVAASGTSRAATDRHSVPEDVSPLLEAGIQLSVGWPHPLAAKDLWPITLKALTGPVGYRDRALGLSSTRYVVKQTFSEPDEGPTALLKVSLEENPTVLPLVRAYEQAVVVADPGIAPLMATSLAHKDVVTVTGHPRLARAMRGVPAEVVGSGDACEQDKRVLPAPVAGELAMACDLRTWVNQDSGQVILGREGSGAVFRPELDGLRGIAVRLDRLPGQTQLVLREMEPDGRTLGREVLRVGAAGIDENQIADFQFSPLPDSGGRTFAFLLSCPACGRDEEPELLTGRPSEADGGNLVGDGLLQPLLNAAFVLNYDRVADAAPPSTSVTGRRRGPGRWTIETSGQRPAVVVVADSWFPGWRAQVDGKRVPVMKADGAFLGVAVDPGRHTIEIEYRKPAAAVTGRVVTGGTLLVVLGFFTAPRRRRRRAASRLAAGHDGPRPREAGAARPTSQGELDGRSTVGGFPRSPVRRRLRLPRRTPPTDEIPAPSGERPPDEARRGRGSRRGAPADSRL